VGRPAAGALYVVAMAAVVVGVDVLFFRAHFWERLAANVGIVLVFVDVRPAAVKSMLVCERALTRERLIPRTTQMRKALDSADYS
jgi:uncharacterized membrane protein